MAVTNTAQGIIERGMKLYAEVDTNIRAVILDQLSDYLDKLWASYDINQAAKTATIALSASTETVAMPTDLLRVDSITYDDPYRGFMPRELTPRQYNYWQSIYQNTSGTPPWGFWPNYADRTLHFQPVSGAAINGLLMYYPQYADVALATDLSFFPNTRQLVLFCYLSYVYYDHAEPNPLYLQEFQQIESLLTFKYWSGGDSPVKDEDWYWSPEISIN